MACEGCSKKVGDSGGFKGRILFVDGTEKIVRPVYGCGREGGLSKFGFKPFV